ncbi:MAG: signal peptidase I [Clostridia bacterium]|jgi:signal peptidase I
MDEFEEFDDFDKSDSEEKEEISNKQRRRKELRKDILQWVNAILIALLVAYLLKAFVFERAQVDGHSMDNTLQDKQTLIEYKLGVLFSAPSRGDIVVVELNSGNYSKYLPIIDNDPNNPEVDLIKRVIGLPGETVDIKGGFVYVTNEKGTAKLIEPYVQGTTEKTTSALNIKYPYKVPNDSIFVMGDNRNISEDSRFFGAFKISAVRGVAVFRISPFKDFGALDKSGKVSLEYQPK